jgi:hypothetical protein
MTSSRKKATLIKSGNNEGKDTNLLTSYNTMIEDNHLSIAPRNILIALKNKNYKIFSAREWCPSSR